MFTKLFKKSTALFTQPLAGTLKDISQVNDEVFATKMMGPGFAITPATTTEKVTIYAPANGEVISVFPTKHAITMKLANQLEVLMHIGLDTVELEGAPFKVLVSAGDKITPKTPLIEVDFAAIKVAGKEQDVLFVFTNAEVLKDFPQFSEQKGPVGTELFPLTFK